MSFSQISKGIIIFTFLISYKTNAQTFTYNLQSTNLSFDYKTLANFTVPRTVPKALTLTITNTTRGRYNIFCKILPVSNQNFGSIPSSLFSITLNSANFQINNAYYQQINLGLNDTMIASASGRARRTDTINFDLILNPLNFSYDAYNYNYSFIFTVTEL